MSRYINFADLKEGDAFYIAGRFYMVTQEIKDRKKKKWNSVCLEDGSFIRFKPHTIVEKVEQMTKSEVKGGKSDCWFYRQESDRRLKCIFPEEF